MAISREDLEKLTKRYFKPPSDLREFTEALVPDPAQFPWKTLSRSVTVKWDDLLEKTPETEEDMGALMVKDNEEALKHDHETWNGALDILYPRG